MRVLFSSLAASLALTATAALASPEVGAPAPAFTGVTTSGETVSLADLMGQKVILEWTNHDCPFVKKHYESGNMQMTQSEAAEDGYTWITVISSAPGKQGYVTAAQADELTESRSAVPAYVVLDPEGTIGTAYDAKTTPHMYIIDDAGTLVYAGGIDSIPSTDIGDLEEAENYVLAAMSDIDAGQPVATPQSKPYGCSVKY